MSHMEAVFSNGIIGTIIAGGILITIIAMIIRSMILDKRKGKSLQCGGDCKHCGGHCGH